MTAFTDGLTQTKLDDSTITVEGKPDNTALEKANDVLADHVPLTFTVQGKLVEADVYEVFWGPLFNGATNPVSFLWWVVSTIWNASPSFRLDNKAVKDAVSKGRKLTPSSKWFYELSYVTLAIFVIGFLTYCGFAGTVLGLDQADYYARMSTLKEWRPDDSRTQPHLYAGERAALGLTPSEPDKPPVSTLGDKEKVESRHADTTHMVMFANGLSNPPTMNTLWGSGAVPSFLTRALTYPFNRNRYATLSLAKITDIGAVLEAVSLNGVLRTVPYAISLVLSYYFFFVAFGLWCRVRFRSTLEDRTKNANEPNPSKRYFSKVTAHLKRSGNWGSYTSRLWREIFGFVIWVAIANILGFYAPIDLTFLVFSFACFQAAYQGTKWAITYVAGDVQVYMTRNENDDAFEAKEKVLELTVNTISGLCSSPTYEGVIVVGHSLGSVIGLDCLRRMYTASVVSQDTDSPFKQVEAYVTIGSPLEKTRKFFTKNDYKSRYEEFRYDNDQSILKAPDSTLPFGVGPVPWSNFWITGVKGKIVGGDIVSDPLATYPCRNVSIDPDHKDLAHRLWPHSDYWLEPQFVKEFAEIVAGVP